MDVDIAQPALFPPFDTCPGCRARGLQVVAVSDRASFLCRACCSCWHVDLGWVHRVDPAVCPGCPQRRLCLAGLCDLDELAEPAAAGAEETGPGSQLFCPIRRPS